MKNNYLDLFQRLKEDRLTELTINNQNIDEPEKFHLDILKELLYVLYYNKEDTDGLVFFIKRLVLDDAKTIEKLFPNYVNDPDEINYSWLFMNENISPIIQLALETMHFEALKEKNIEILSKINRILFDNSSALSSEYLEKVININSLDKLLRIDLFYIWQDLNAKKLQEKKFVRLKSSTFREVFADDYFIPTQINFYKESHPFESLNIFIYRASECYILRDDADFFLSLVEILESVLFNCTLISQNDLHLTLEKISDTWSKKLLNDLINEKSFELAIEKKNQWMPINTECGISNEDVPSNPRKVYKQLIQVLNQVKAPSMTATNFARI